MSVTVPGTMAEAGLGKGPFRAARGTEISCKGWQQEAALRMVEMTVGECCIIFSGS
jgi:urocanate hydratase